MRNWFNCKVSYDKLQEDGTQKKVIEEYLVDALSFTEAEARITDEISKMVRGEFQVTSITKSRIAELHKFDDADTWYNCKVAFISYDEKSNKEKQTVTQMLVMANDVKDAYEKIELKMTGTMADYTVPSIAKSKILDVLEYDPNAVPSNLRPLSEEEKIQKMEKDILNI